MARFLSKRGAQILQIGCLLLDAYRINLAQECDAACRSSAFVVCKCQQNHLQVYTRHKTLQNSSRPTTYCYHLGHLWAEVNQQTYFWTHDQGFIYTVEPLNKGPIGMSRYVPYLEVSFTGRLNNNFLIIIILILRFIAIPL